MASARRERSPRSAASTSSTLQSLFPVLSSRSTTAPATPRFRILANFRHPIVQKYQRFIGANGIGIAGIELITDANGELYTYDVNTNTNYNSDAERAAGIYGMRAIARYLGEELERAGQASSRIAVAA